MTRDEPRTFASLGDYLASIGVFDREPAPSSHVVYFIGGDEGPVKIGMTTNLALRLQHMQTGSPIELKVLATVAGGAEVERGYHAAFANYRIRGEWFERSPAIVQEINYLSAKCRQRAQSGTRLAQSRTQCGPARLQPNGAYHQREGARDGTW